MLFDKVFCDDDLFDALLGGDIVHHGEHEFFHDGAKPARADVACNGEFCNSLARAVFKFQLHAVERQQLCILLDDCILRLTQDTNQRRFVEIIQRGDDRQSAHKLGNQPVLDDVMRIDIPIDAARSLFLLRFNLAAETDGLSALPLFDDLRKPIKCFRCESE